MDIVQVLIQGGAVGIALVALWIVWKLSGNHIHHNTEALHSLKENTSVNTEVLRSLKDSLDENTDTIRLLKK